MSQQFGFDKALVFLENGMRVRRCYWKNAHFIYLVKASMFEVGREPLTSFMQRGALVNYKAHIDVCSAPGIFGTWAPSNDDVLAKDWEVVE